MTADVGGLLRRPVDTVSGVVRGLAVLLIKVAPLIPSNKRVDDGVGRPMNGTGGQGRAGMLC